MPTQVMFERQIESVLGTAPEPFDDAPDACRRDVGPLQVDLSLHDDLASIEKEWRAFEERGRLHCVPDLRLAFGLAAQSGRPRGREAGDRDRPAIKARCCS